MYPSEVYTTLSGLTPTAKLVFIYFCDRANGKSVAWPSLATVAADLNLTYGAVKRAVTALVNSGRLVPEGWGPGQPRHQARRYRVVPRPR